MREPAGALGPGAGGGQRGSGIDFAALSQAEGLTGPAAPAAQSEPVVAVGAEDPGLVGDDEPARIETAAAEDRAAAAPRYLTIETRLLDPTLVNFIVEMQGARRPSDVEAYARCAAAQYAVIRGYGFARHVRTNVHETGGAWRGDAVYTISAALPLGARTIDAEVTLAECRDRDIPTV